DGPDVVDGQAVGAAEEPDAARGGEPADADPAVVPGADRPAEGLEGGRDLTPAGARTDPDEPRGLVEHLDAVEAGDVEDDAAVVRRAAAHPVARAAQRERDVLGAGEAQRLGHL